MPRYRLTINGAVSGPHSVEALKQMAALRAFDHTTLISADDAEWKAIRDFPELEAELFPARPIYKLKAKTIVPINEPGEAISVHEILVGNLAKEKSRKAEAQQAAEPPPTPRRRVNRRRRDFLKALATANLVGIVAAVVLPLNIVVLTFLAAYFAVANIGLYWVYYQIMDRY